MKAAAPVPLVAIRLGLVVMFIAATVTAPLYFQNQNTKFLHGLATAFPERLGADWTAATRDGLPVFSALVHAVASASSPLVFYLIEAALLAIMCLSLLEIARLSAPRHRDSPVFLLIAASVLVALVHPPQETSLRGVAQQYMMHGYLQPSEFGILYLPALLLAVARRPVALVVMAVPAAIHPAYILISAIGIAAILWDRRRAGAQLPLLFLALALALLVLPPVDLALRFAPTDPESFARANDILAFERIPHHSDPRLWADFDALRKLGIALAALAVAPNRLTRVLLFALLAVALGGAGYVALTGNAEIALMAPWRASIVIVPVADAILLGWVLERILDRVRDRRLVAGLAALAFGWAGLAAAGGMAIKWRDFAGAQFPDHIRFAHENYSPGDIYLTSPDMADFRLDAMVAQFVTRKTHPYLDTEVIEWDHRLRLAERVFPSDGPLQCGALDEVLALYEISHVLVAKDKLPQPPCARLAPLFEGESHSVLAIRPPG
ncbi:DUF6798 domain-containing protein [Tropicimonas sp. IMCC6043]|uniref:DUF6798 domain-containing protein n=1 Tax=Tropicimonas sp. IMCC6043 TaxID=2510645 RepID=UPI00101C42A2|nr:DUF6798 domain-containing protein [Tropicimonas sp. IMCC6043]RYH08183.1 hypothetical protein EU800_17090 [Tropicimonas sp. IMCC6043]